MGNLIDDLAKTVDDVLYNVVGIKPAEKVVSLAQKLGPATVISDVTGISKPEATFSKIASDVEGTGRKLKPRRPF